MEHNLFFGTAYTDAYLPQCPVEEDLDRIKAANFNLICYGADSWERWERAEGVYDFTSFHRVLSGAQSRQLGVIMVLPLDTLPGWLSGREQDYALCSQRFLHKLMQQCRNYDCIVGFCLGQRERETEETARRGQIVRAYASADQFLTGYICYNLKKINWEQADPFETAQLIDVASCGIYHRMGQNSTGMEVSMAADMGRCLRKDNFFVLRTQSQGRAGQLPYPGQLRLAAYHHLSGGADCVCYESFTSDYSGDGKGILSHDRTLGRVYTECSRIGQELSCLADRLAGLQKQNRVAILVSKRSMMLSRWPEDSDKGYCDYVQWVYDSFYRLNIEVDVLPVTHRDFTGYDLLVVPCLYSAEDNLIWAIRDYVAGGGKLIATFRSFFADENGRVRSDAQPYGMTDVFGMTYDEYTVPQDTNLPEYASEVEEWMELLHCTGAGCVASYGGTEWPGVTAVTCSRFGRGSAAYIGCYSPEGLEPILLRLLTAWHIPVPEISWPVVVKRGINRQGRPITYLLHYSGSARVIPSPAAGMELLSGCWLDEGAPLELKPWDVKILEGNV